jgi:hypothetical protein
MQPSYRLIKIVRHWKTNQPPDRFFAKTLKPFLPLVSVAALPAQAQSSQRRPKLVVLLVVDQFSYNYLPRYLDKFTAGGIKLPWIGERILSIANFKTPVLRLLGDFLLSYQAHIPGQPA